MSNRFNTSSAYRCCPRKIFLFGRSRMISNPTNFSSLSIREQQLIYILDISRRATRCHVSPHDTRSSHRIFSTRFLRNSSDNACSTLLSSRRISMIYLIMRATRSVTNLTTLSWTGTRCQETEMMNRSVAKDGDFIDDAEVDLEGDATMASNDQAGSNEDYSVVRGLFIRRYQAQLNARFQ